MIIIMFLYNYIYIIKKIWFFAKNYLLKPKIRNCKVKFINDTKDVVVFFDEELYKYEKKIFNFKKFITEKVQTDWFEKNHDFYLSKNKKEIQSDKQENIEKLQSELKKKSINEIKFIKIRVV